MFIGDLVSVITFATLLCKSGKSISTQAFTVTILISALESNCNLIGPLPTGNIYACRRFAATVVCTNDIFLDKCLSGLLPCWYPNFFLQLSIGFFPLIGQLFFQWLPCPHKQHVLFLVFEGSYCCVVFLNFATTAGVSVTILACSSVWSICWHISIKSCSFPADQQPLQTS